MMTKSILAFLVFSGISSLAYWYLIPKKWRKVFLLICSLLFIASLNLLNAVYFLVNIVFVYSAGVFIRKSNKRSKLILQITLPLLVGNLFFLKYINLLLLENNRFSLFPKILFPEILLPIGLSYLTFRLIHYIVDVYRNDIPNNSFVDFSLYILFFPVFLAGPIERFQSFYKQTIAKNSADISNINYGLFRILEGLIKKLIIADNLLKLIMPVFLSPGAYSRFILICAIYGLAIQIYMDFSGYADMAIGISRLFGYKIMENFNKPFLQKNIALFWRNWHISVYTLIRDYFFYPFFGAYRRSKIMIYLGIFVTIMVFMLWHRWNINFLILGIYHGFGLVTWYIFQEVKRKNLPVHRVSNNKLTDLISIFLTFNFVSLSSILFSLRINVVKDVLFNLFKI